MEELFENKGLLKVCAPMVRFSRLPFRLLVREYGCDLAFTPMLMPESFIKSETYRNIEYSIIKEDSPLIAQFASNNAEELIQAAELAYKDCIGVDLNCGCPQSWATKDGIGACMLNKPEHVSDILKQTRNRISDNSFSISCKIRIFKDMKRTVDVARQIQASGITFLTVHGRTKEERSEPVHLEYIKAIVDALDIPVIANGDVDSLEKAYQIQEITGAKGVMSARRILDNPAFFSGAESTPIDCIKRFIEINQELDSPFTMFHRHLMNMTGHLMSKEEKKVFNRLTKKEDVIDFINEKIINN